jgi:prefoldin subunit 5
MSAVTNASGIAPPNLQGMDLETAMMAVQSQRANLLESQLKDQIASVQKKNEQISQLNLVLGSLNAATAKASSGAKATDKVDISSSAASEIAAALKSAGISTPAGLESIDKPPYTITLKDGTKFEVDAALAAEAEGHKKANIAWKSHDYSGAKAVVSVTENKASATKGDLDAAIQTVKSQIDSLSNTQQMDMLRLQSLSNKRNEAFETMTNFIKKMQDNRSSIVGNMR